MKLKGNLGNSRGTNGEIEFWGNQSQRGIRTTTHVGGNQGGVTGGTNGGTARSPAFRNRVRTL